MWYEHKKGIFNLNLVRRVYIDDRAFNELVLVFSLHDTRQLAFDTEEEMCEAYQYLRTFCLPPEDADGNK